MVEQAARMNAVFHALAHEVRREMPGRLARGVPTVGELAAPLSMSFEAAFKHVRVLERAGLVQRTIEGRTGAMSQSEVLARLNDPVAQELLRSASLARLAYIGTDGTPRVIPIGFYWTGRAIVVCTAPSAPKVRALQANEHVALTIDTEQHPPQQLLVRGTATLDVVDGVPPEYLRATEKGLPEDQWDQFAAQVRGMYKQMARITIVPTWASVFDFATGRVPAFLQRLAEERSAVGDGNE